jgi:hypothetical protein
MRHFVYRSEVLRTTWKLRLGVLSLVALSLWLTSGWWTVAIAGSLVCDESLSLSDAILVENSDPDYLVFERARQLRQAGRAPRVLVPIWTDPGTSTPNDVALGLAEVMARVSRLGPVEIIPVHDVEPITLNVARQIRRFLERERIRSVTIVSPLFRSRRTDLVYSAVLGQAGLGVTCVSARSTHSVNNWTQSWHGIEDVLQQWLKLQYYRMYVLPFEPRGRRPAGEPIPQL